MKLPGVPRAMQAAKLPSVAGSMVFEVGDDGWGRFA